MIGHPEPSRGPREVTVKFSPRDSSTPLGMTAEEGRASSHRFFADLFRPNADCVFNRKNKNFTVADFAGFGRAHHYGDGFFSYLVCEHDFNFHLRQKINGVFAAAINFGVPFLPAK